MYLLFSYDANGVLFNFEHIKYIGKGCSDRSEVHLIEAYFVKRMKNDDYKGKLSFSEIGSIFEWLIGTLKWEKDRLFQTGRWSR